MKHTPEAMRDIARRIDEVAFNTGAIFPRAVNEAVAMLRDIADEMEATNYPEIPEGWRLVPIDPTDEMVAAFWGDIQHGDVELAHAWDAYKDMLAAAPLPKGACEHEWVDASNSCVQGGELCLKCYAIRATLSPKGDV
jgi:hypothetical protein